MTIYEALERNIARMDALAVLVSEPLICETARGVSQDLKACHEYLKKNNFDIRSEEEPDQPEVVIAEAEEPVPEEE